MKFGFWYFERQTNQIKTIFLKQILKRRTIQGIVVPNVNVKGVFMNEINVGFLELE